MSEQDITRVLATDCGSTTTKAILIEKQDGQYRLVARGEAPTTVEAPYEDVTRGVLNAVAEVEELAGRTLLDGEAIIRPAEGDIGADLYLSTSSAGGGLQIMVVGLVRRMTAESAERAALGAGAIVMDVLALDDGRLPHERIDRMRALRPDMILVSGGIDGGEKRRVVEMAELVQAARPTPRLGARYRLPIIFAGNVEAREKIRKTLDDIADLTVTDNLRPTMEEENLEPTRQVIQDLFLHHVMAQAPGYSNLVPWTDADIMPTPRAVGNIIQTIARREEINVVGVDIGGATTDVFSVFDGQFNRSVSANLGMSYSISNVLAETGIANILRWAAEDVDAQYMKNQIRNKMIRPTTIPQQLSGLRIEQGIAREALRLAFDQHRSLAAGLKGIQRTGDISSVFAQELGGGSIVDMMSLDLLVGSGGVLSHAPRRAQAALMLVDAFMPEGFTRLAVDSIFMMPQLGVLAEVHEEAATQVFWRDCLIPLGECLAPVGQYREGRTCMTITITQQGHSQEREIRWGDFILIPLGRDETAEITVDTVFGVDAGDGPGRSVEHTATGGEVGLIIDGRGRTIQIPQGIDERIRRVRQWHDAVDAYPERSGENTS
ncbi:MAG: glutamate mutase L [Armatimonadota bacterium]